MELLRQKFLQSSIAFSFLLLNEYASINDTYYEHLFLASSISKTGKTGNIQIRGKSVIFISV